MIYNRGETPLLRQLQRTTRSMSMRPVSLLPPLSVSSLAGEADAVDGVGVAISQVESADAANSESHRLLSLETAREICSRLLDSDSP